MAFAPGPKFWGGKREECSMGKGLVTVFCGEGKGKTSAALGQAIFGAGQGKTVNIIQFLKGKTGERMDIVKRLEPEIKVFAFEKSDASYQSLTPKEQQEENMNIRNGLNFAKKVLSTEGCDVLILDEVLGLIDKGIITIEEMIALIGIKDEDMDLVLTGICIPEGLLPHVDKVYEITVRK